jgi:hypothetical protein
VIVINFQIGKRRSVGVHVRRDAIEDGTKVDTTRSDGRAIRMDNFETAIGLAVNGITDLETDLAIVNVKGHDEGNVLGPLASNIRLHQTRGRILLGTFRRLFPDALDERRSAVADPNDADLDHLLRYKFNSKKLKLTLKSTDSLLQHCKLSLHLSQHLSKL